MRRLIFKLTMVVLTTCLSTDVALRLIGFINRHVLKARLGTAMLVYFADARYLESRTFAWYAQLRKWTPCIGGVFFQGNAGGAICAVGCSEAEFADPGNRPQLLKMQQRMQRIGQLLGTANVSYAGILPSQLVRAGVVREPIEADRTVQWVVLAVDLLRRRCGLPKETPVVVIGAMGFIGARIVALLRETGVAPVMEIDPAHPTPANRDSSVIEPLRGCAAIVLNASRNQVIESYAAKFWQGVVVLNEVYPECSASTLATLKDLGVRYFHLQGIRATAWPRFPRAYGGAVPCCAASAASASRGLQQSDAEEILLKEL